MTLNINEPTDQRDVSELPLYIREGRVAINALEAGDVEVVTTNLVVATGQTELVVGTDLSASSIEVVMVSSLGAAIVSQITGGTNGRIKVLIFQVNNVSLRDGPKSSGQLYLNQLPALSVFSVQRDDVIAFANIGGDGAAVDGYWKEIWRQMSVK